MGTDPDCELLAPSGPTSTYRRGEADFLLIRGVSRFGSANIPSGITQSPVNLAARLDSLQTLERQL